MEETLLLLPYSAACDILQRLPNLLKNDYHAELLARLALCLVRAYHGPIVANQNLLPTLEIVKKLAVEKISTLRVMKAYLLTVLFMRMYYYLSDELMNDIFQDAVGFNLHGMIYMQRILEEREGIKFFRDATKNVEHKKKIKRNKEKAIKRAVMNL